MPQTAAHYWFHHATRGNAFRPNPLAVSCHSDGTEVEFQIFGKASSLAIEQFWGRAVRASRDSKEFGTLLILPKKENLPKKETSRRLRLLLGHGRLARRLDQIPQPMRQICGQ
jgi:hypothetical protein